MRVSDFLSWIVSANTQSKTQTGKSDCGAAWSILAGIHSQTSNIFNACRLEITSFGVKPAHPFE